MVSQKLFNRIQLGLLWCTGALLALMFLVPIVWLFISAFRPASEIFSYTMPLTIDTFVPRHWTLDNFVNLFGRGWTTYLYNSMFVSVSVTLLGTLVAALAAFAFAKGRFPGKNLFFALALATTIIAFEVIALPLYLQVRDFGWLDTYKALIIPHVANGLNIFLLRQFFAQIPDSLMESARIDGATSFGIFWWIFVPLSWPAIISVALLTFQANWDSFFWPLIATTSPRVRVLQVAIASLFGIDASRWDELFAAVFVAAIPPVLLFLTLQRHYVRGLISTGIKG